MTSCVYRLTCDCGWLSNYARAETPEEEARLMGEYDRHRAEQHQGEFPTRIFSAGRGDDLGLSTIETEKVRI